MEKQINHSIDQKRQNIQVRIGVVLSYVLIAINIISGFFLVPFILKSIGDSGYGIYSTATAVISMFLIDFGLSTATTKFISNYRRQQKQLDIDVLIGTIFKIYIVISLLILIAVVIFFFFLPSIYIEFTAQELEQFKYVFIMIGGYSILSFPFSVFDGVLIAYERLFLNKIADIISKIAFIASTLLVLYLDFGLYALTACFLLHGLISLLLKGIFVFSKTPVRPKSLFIYPLNKKLIVTIISFSIWASINALSTKLIVVFTPTVLGTTSGTTEITYFSLAYQIEQYLSMFALVFGTILFPKVTQILLKGDSLNEENKKNFETLFVKTSRIQIVVLGLLIIGLVFVGKDFIFLWAGPSYEISYYCILLICVPAIIFYPLQLAIIGMAAIDKIKHCALINLVSSVAFIGLSYLLSFTYGAIGASIAICCSTIARSIMLLIVFRKHLNIGLINYLKESYLTFLLPFAITSSVAYATMFISGSGWIYMIAKILSITSAYFLSIWFLGFKQQEKHEVRNFVRSLGMLGKSKKNA